MNDKPLPATSREFSFDATIGTMSVSTRIPFSFAVRISAQRPTSNARIIQELLSETSELNGSKLTIENAQILSAAEIEAISALIVEDGLKETPSPGRDMVDVLADHIAYRGDISSNSQFKAAMALGERFLSKTIPAPMAAPLPNLTRMLPPTKRNDAAEAAINKVLIEADALKAQILSDDRIVSLVSVSAPGGGSFLIADMQPDGEYITLTGIADGEDKTPSRVVQHYSQLNIMITDIARPAKFGFT